MRDYQLSYVRVAVGPVKGSMNSMKIKKFLFAVVCSFLALGSFNLAIAQEASPAGGRQQTQERQARGGVFTLYALDQLARTLCFRDGRAGMMFEKNQWGNRCSDLTFTLAGDGSFVTGTEANRIAAIVDLGTPLELRDRYGYEDAADGGVGFASLRLQGDTILILKDDNPHEQLQPLKEGAALFGELRPSANAQVRLGHIYLIRLADKKDKNFQHIVKLVVIAYRPNEAVTIRWEPL